MSPGPFRVTDRRHRGKLIAGLGIAALAAAALIGYLVWTGYQAAIRAAETETRNYAAIMEARLHATLRGADAQLQELARSIPVAALNAQAASTYAAEIDANLKFRLTSFPELESLRIFDAGGNLIYFSDDKAVPGTNIADRSHFRQVRDSPPATPVFSEVVISRVTGRPGIFMVEALRDQSGVFRGAVFAGISLEYFQTLFRSLELGAMGNVAIYRSDDFRQVLRWPPSGVTLNAPLPSDSPARKAMAAGGKVATLEIVSATDGVARIYANHALDRYPFFVSVGMARADALASWRGRSEVVGLSGLLLVGSLVGLMLLLLRAMDALTANQELLSSTFQQAAVGIAHIDPVSNRILIANQRYCDLLGFSLDELLASDVHKITPVDELTSREAERARLVAGEVATSTSERRLVRKDGAAVWFNRSLSLVRDAAGQPKYFISVIEDISARKQAENELRDNRTLLHSIIDSTPSYIFAIDLQHRYTLLNDAMARFYSVPKEQVLGNTVYGVFSREVADALMATDRGVMASGEPQLIQEVLTSAAGKVPRVMMVSKFPLRDAQGRVTGMGGVATDITERVNAEAARASLEAQLRESQKMEAIGTLAGGIAHDFNNIIAIVLGNAELLRQDLGEQPKAAGSLEEIRRAGRRGRELVQQILSFSRRQPTEREPIAVEPVIRESERLLRALLPARITLEVHCDAGVPAVLADAIQIQQIVINLVTNSMQAMQGKPGRIGVRLDTVMLDAALANAHPALGTLHDRHPGPTVRLAVSDDGIGMDAATRARIFEPFFTTKPAGEGTGLGLSVVLGIVQTHEGAIEIHSEPGKGAVFTLYLPAAPAPTSAAATGKIAAIASAAPDVEGGQRVLYIDDDDSLVFVVQRLLERRGLRVSGHVDSQEALAALRAAPDAFDLVVTDYNMPGMSGLDVAREVRAIRPNLPVAVISGFIDEELRAQAGAAGVRELILKAAAVEELCDVFVRLARAVETSATSS